MASLNPLNPFNIIKPIKSIKKIIERGPEALSKEPTGIIKGVVDSAKQDLAKASVEEMWREILQVPKKAGEMLEGQEIDLSQHHAAAQDAPEAHGEEEESSEKKKHVDADPHINYRREVLHYRESIQTAENRELTQKVNEIMVELKRLVDSSTIVTAELQAVSVSDAPKEVGKYHINFFEWMLLTLQAARMKIEDSGAWLATMKGKNGKKNGGMLLDAQKKGNTSVSMSNERSVATQTG
jgi:hypothetical protein